MIPAALGAQLTLSEYCAFDRVASGLLGWKSPSEPEGPEAPSLVVWGRYLLHHAMREGSVIRGAPVGFIIAVLIGTAFATMGVRWWINGEYANQIDNLHAANDNLDATIKTQQATIQLQEKQLFSFTNNKTSVGDVQSSRLQFVTAARIPPDFQ